MNMERYVIGTGWWCTNQDHDGATRLQTYGDDQIRSECFNEKWYQSISDNTNPQQIIIVDSASPIPPPIIDIDSRIQYLRLNENGGHATNLKGKYCGWTRSVIVGLSYTLCCDADYFVYVEQDVLLSGRGIIEKCIETMKTNYMFGETSSIQQPLQQSFFVIKRQGIERFLSRLYRINRSDYEFSPEEKFVICSGSMLSPLCAFPPRGRNIMRKRCRVLIRRCIQLLSKLSFGHFFLGFDLCPFGCGRERPIDFRSEYYYFQHGTESELLEYEKNHKY